MVEHLTRAGFPLSTRELVTIALKTLHRDCLEARAELPARNSYYTGFGLQDLGNCLYAVSSRVPTIQVADYIESDLGFFKFHKDLRAFDGQWPGKLVAENRFKMVGGSDIGFQAELTPADRGGRNPLVDITNDYVWNGAHNQMCGNYTYTMRSSEPVDLDAIARARGLTLASREGV